MWYFASKLVFDILRPFWSIFTECRADQTRRPCFASMWPLANFHFPFELINRDWWQWREKTKASISHKWTRFSSKWTAFVSSPVFLIYEGLSLYPLKPPDMLQTPPDTIRHGPDTTRYHQTCIMYGLYGLKHHIVEISGDVTDAGRDGTNDKQR